MPTQPNDPYAWWRKALVGSIGFHEGDPQPGRYKWRRRIEYRVYGPWLPAAIWLDEYGKLACHIGGESRDPYDQWIWLALNPISQEAYHIRMTTGVWPEEAARAAQTVIVSEPTKAFKKFNTDVEILARLQALCERHYVETGRLPPGAELKKAETVT